MWTSTKAAPEGRVVVQERGEGCCGHRGGSAGVPQGLQEAGTTVIGKAPPESIMNVGEETPEGIMVTEELALWSSGK